ncbi:cyclin-dependent kinase inhibitor 3 [Canna indica]|uniref:Cyclin-dependent kinase inhibitor 3 n=1 Tax=Canna indica TaxID=4628 RepID=A0AAQ3JYE2_9LILI|nr:cyclin-dependent kinase inhibitor 3 [Canna indica]
MGKGLRKCTRIADLAVMEGTQRVEARTKAAGRLGLVKANGHKRRKTPAENPISYLELRNRSVVLKPRIRRSAANSGDLRRSSPELGRTSRCSNNASCEAHPSSELCHECDTDSFSHYNGERGVWPASSNHGDEASDVESTVQMESRRRSTSGATPSAAELDEFFAAAENDLRRRFAERWSALLPLKQPHCLEKWMTSSRLNCGSKLEREIALDLVHMSSCETVEAVPGKECHLPRHYLLFSCFRMNQNKILKHFLLINTLLVFDDILIYSCHIICI